MTVNLSSATFKSNGSTTSRSVGTRAADRINVKDYGALGDGTTDDRAAIQRAIDAAFGSSGSPNGYTNRALNKALYFPTSSQGGYHLGDSLTFTHVYGGLIYGDPTALAVTAGTNPVFVIDGMVETVISNLTFSNSTGATCNIDLDWNGTWTDLPAGSTTHGLRQNVFENMQLGTAARGVRVANSSNDGAFNTFMYVNIDNTTVAAIDLVGTGAYGNTVYGGGCNTTSGSGYAARGGGFSIISGVSNGSNTSLDFDIDTAFPTAILGGRSEGNGTVLDVAAGSSALVAMRGFNVVNGIGIANINSGKVVLDSVYGKGNVAGKPSSTWGYITGSSGQLYLRGCDIGSSVTSSYTGTISQNI